MAVSSGFAPAGRVTMLRNVAVVVVNGFLPFEFGTICEVFGVDRADDRLPSYEFAVVAGEPPPLRAHNDFTIHPSCGLERLEEADLIALPAVDDDRLSIYAGQSRRPRGRTRRRNSPRTCWRRCAGRWTAARGC